MTRFKPYSCGVLICGLMWQPVETDGDGDGTVNLMSLQVCELWNSTQSEPVTSMVFEGISHSDMISNSTAVQAVVAIIQALG